MLLGRLNSRGVRVQLLLAPLDLVLLRHFPLSFGRRTARYAEERWLYAAEPVAHVAPASDSPKQDQPALDPADNAKGDGH